MTAGEIELQSATLGWHQKIQIRGLKMRGRKGTSDAAPLLELALVNSTGTLWQLAMRMTRAVVNCEFDIHEEDFKLLRHLEEMGILSKAPTTPTSTRAEPQPGQGSKPPFPAAGGVRGEETEAMEETESVASSTPATRSPNKHAAPTSPNKVSAGAAAGSVLGSMKQLVGYGVCGGGGLGGVDTKAMEERESVADTASSSSSSSAMRSPNKASAVAAAAVLVLHAAACRIWGMWGWGIREGGHQGYRGDRESVADTASSSSSATRSPNKVMTMLSKADSTMDFTADLHLPGDVHIYVSEGKLLVPSEMRDMVGPHLHVSAALGEAELKEWADQVGEDVSWAEQTENVAGPSASVSLGQLSPTALSLERRRGHEAEHMKAGMRIWHDMRQDLTFLHQPAQARLGFTPQFSKFGLVTANPILANVADLRSGQGHVMMNFIPDGMQLPYTKATFQISPMALTLRGSDALGLSSSSLQSAKIEASISQMDVEVIKGGSVKTKRVDMTLGRPSSRSSLSLSLWGSMDPQTDSIDMVIALSPSALSQLGITDLPEDYLLQYYSSLHHCVAKQVLHQLCTAAFWHPWFSAPVYYNVRPPVYYTFCTLCTNRVLPTVYTLSAHWFTEVLHPCTKGVRTTVYY
eukprot:gene25667-11332_t